MINNNLGVKDTAGWHLNCLMLVLQSGLAIHDDA